MGRRLARTAAAVIAAAMLMTPASYAAGTDTDYGKGGINIADGCLLSDSLDILWPSEAETRLMNAFIARKPSCTVCVSVGEVAGMDAREAAIAAKEEMLEGAFEHCFGMPCYGDYLRAHVYEMPCDIEVWTADSGYTVRYSFHDIRYMDTAEQEKKVASRIDEVLDQLALDGLSTYAKARSIYSYIIEGRYDTSAAEDDLYSHSAYAALIDRSAVCQGYSSLLYRMLLEADIDARIVRSKTHSFCIAEIDGMYYYLDPTWDLGAANPDWFLIGQDTLEHRMDKEHTLLSDEFGSEFFAEFPVSEKDAEEPVQDHVHRYGEWAVKTEPTCTDKGIRVRHCSCGESETEEIKALGHTYEVAAASYAGFMKKGSTREICTRCGAYGRTFVTAPVTIWKTSGSAYTYTGRSIKPSVTVKDSDGKSLRKGTSYEVEYEKSSSSVGQHTAYIELKGLYSGRAAVSYRVLPKKAEVKSTSAGKRSVLVDMKTKVSSTGGDRYRIGYRIKGTSTWKYMRATGKTVRIKGLKKGKRYQIRVRAEKSGYCGKWSSVRTSGKVK